MLVHSKILFKNLDKNQIQPNAVDLKIVKIWGNDPYSTFTLTVDKAKTERRKRIEVERCFTSAVDNMFVLRRGYTYEFDTDQTVEIPEGYAGWLIPRSTLSRSGLFIGNALYDSGYKGIIGGTIYNIGGDSLIEKNARICQFLLVKAETSHLYDGSYQTLNSCSSQKMLPADAGIREI